jgi:hypothetical protein
MSEDAAFGSRRLVDSWPSQAMFVLGRQPDRLMPL